MDGPELLSGMRYHHATLASLIALAVSACSGEADDELMLLDASDDTEAGADAQWDPGLSDAQAASSSLTCTLGPSDLFPNFATARNGQLCSKVAYDKGNCQGIRWLPEGNTEITEVGATAAEVDAGLTPQGGTVSIPPVQKVEGRFWVDFPAIDVAGKSNRKLAKFKVALYIPESWANAPTDEAFFYAEHYAGEVHKDDFAARLATDYNIPVMYTGAFNSWCDLGYQSRGVLNRVSFPLQRAKNQCTANDYVWGNYPRHMAEKNITAMTVFQRLVEEQGIESPTEFAVRGFSKEAHGVWLASLVDDRIKVAAAGGFTTQDPMQSWKHGMDVHGCAPNDPNAVGAETLDWYINSDGGQGYRCTSSIAENLASLQPSVLLIDGDVHMPDMHDSIFNLGAETPFLDGLDRPWRYVRLASKQDDADDGGYNFSRSAVSKLAIEMLQREDPALSYYPDILDTNATISGDILTIDAQATADIDFMQVWLAYSPDMVFNDAGQAPWQSFDMQPDPSGHGSISIDLADYGLEDQVIGWYVEIGAARDNSNAPLDTDLSALAAMRHASPVRFLNATPRTCAPTEVLWCPAQPVTQSLPTGCDPMAGACCSDDILGD